MQKIFLKRTIRDLRRNLFRYLALFLLVILCMFMVVGIVGAAQSVIGTVNTHAEENHLEDGQFGVFRPLTAQEKRKLEDAGAVLEAHFYLDFQMDDGSTLRVMENRKKIDLLDLYDGSDAAAPDEAAVERIYADAHGIETGDTVTIAGKEFTVSGIVTTADYEYCLRNVSDMSADGKTFGTAFVTPEAYEGLLKSGMAEHSEEYRYSYILRDRLTDAELKEMLSSIKISADQAGNLTDLTTADANPRIKAANDDVVINQSVGLVAGVIVLVLITYVISVFIVHSIDSESSVIGALYALGVKRGQLMLHYTMLPTFLCLAGGVIGTAIGYSRLGISLFAGESFSYYSTPQPETVWNPPLLAYGIIVPPLTAWIVNTLIIRKRLNRTALSLLRREQDAEKKRGGEEKRGKEHKRGTGRSVRGGVRRRAGRRACRQDPGYIRTFQIRQLTREKRSSFAVLGGMFVSMLILMLGLTCYALCSNIRTDTAADIRYEAMYLFKYPSETVPEGGYEAYVETLNKEVMGYDMEVTVIGLTGENPFFPEISSRQKNQISISDSVAEKYGLSVGDDLVLNNRLDEMSYGFEVKEVVPYSAGLCVFMDIDSMRELWGQKEDYYNVVYADHELDVDREQLYSVSMREDAVTGAGVFMDVMREMMFTLISVAAVIFLVVLYQMMKVMIDRSARNIALMKIFGYRNKEIRKLYLDGSFVLIMAGTAVLLPASKFLIDAVYPYLVSNVAAGLDLSWQMWMYPAVFAGIAAGYFLIRTALMRRVKAMTPAEVLKERE